MLHHLLILLLGAAAGFLNTLAAGGSVITLPALVSLGFTDHIANGSNRIALVVSCLTRLVVFQRAGIIPWRRSLHLVLPTAFGALAGVLAEHQTSNRSLDVVILLTLILALVLILSGGRKMLQMQPEHALRIRWWAVPLFFAIGAWGGYIAVDSAMFFLWALVVLLGFDLIPANALKALLMLAMAAISTVLMTGEGEVDWTLGGLLSAGTVFGSWLGARCAASEASRAWVYRLLLVVVVAELAWEMWQRWPTLQTWLHSLSFISPG
jgi:uncharacterized membrane protein YfcA